MSKAKFSNIGFCFGDQNNIEELGGRPETDSQIDYLLKDGYQTYSNSNRNVIEMARIAIENSLADGSIQPEQVDLIIFVSECFWDRTGQSEHLDELDSTKKFRRDLYQEIVDLGLLNACPVGSWMSGCSNMVVAIGQAQCMVDSGMANTILVVGSDRDVPGSSRMLGPPGLPPRCVHADAAASLIVSNRDAPGYRIENIVQHSLFSTFSTLQEKKYGERLIQAAKSVNKMAGEFENRAPKPLNAYDHLVLQNFSGKFYDTILARFPMDKGKRFNPTKSKFGEATYASFLANMKSLPEAVDECIMWVGGTYYLTLMEVRVLSD